MLRSCSRGSVALMCGALSLAAVSVSPGEAVAQKGRSQKAPAKKPAAPARKFAAPQAASPPAAAQAAPSAPARAQPAAEDQAKPAPAPKRDAVSDESGEQPKPAGKAAEPADGEKAAKAPAEAHPVAIDIGGGVRAFQRHLGYSSDNAHMRPYDIDPGAAALMVAAELYPAASSTTGAGANIGLVANFQTAIGLKSSYKNPLVPEQQDSYATTSYGYELGLKYRFPFGTSEVGIAVSFGQQVFSLSLPEQPPNMANMTVPAVKYSYILPALGARFGVADGFAIAGGVGYLGVLGAGEMTTDAYFPHASVRGIDLDLGVAIELAKHVEVRPGFKYRAFFYSMGYATGDRFDVGGAFDQYLGLNLLLGYRN
jgi:hypothetical protein